MCISVQFYIFLLLLSKLCQLSFLVFLLLTTFSWALVSVLWILLFFLRDHIIFHFISWKNISNFSGVCSSSSLCFHIPFPFILQFFLPKPHAGAFYYTLIFKWIMEGEGGWFQGSDLGWLHLNFNLLSLSIFSLTLSFEYNFSFCLAGPPMHCKVPYDTDILVWWKLLILFNWQRLAVAGWHHSHCHLFWHTGSLV